MTKKLTKKTLVADKEVVKQAIKALEAKNLSKADLIKEIEYLKGIIFTYKLITK